MPSFPATRLTPTRKRTGTLRLPGVVSGIVLVVLAVACLGSLPWTLGRAASAEGRGLARYNAGDAAGALRSPMWWPGGDEDEARSVARGELERPRERFFLGSDVLGRSLLIRCLTGGGISLTIGVAAAAIAVLVGTLYGSLAGYLGGRWDGMMMRVVDVLYGLPYVLLVVLLAVASGAVVDEYVTRSREREKWMERELGSAQARGVLSQDSHSAAIETPLVAKVDDQMRQRALVAVPPRDISASARTTIDLATLLFSISGVSWLTMARVVRGQVLSLKERPFMDSARALGASPSRIFVRHLLPNLMGTIIVYATLTVPQAILQESFLSFLGIGVKPPLPSWGTLAAEGLPELNAYKSHWWMLVFPCGLLAATLLALNFVGEGLRERLEPRSATR